MTKRTTAADVAQLANVSQSAVSRVYTPGASVSKDTQAKVERAAHELGYRPNTLARAMITGKSNIIGLVVSYMDNQFYPEAIETLSRRFQEQGYYTLMFMASQEDEASKVIANFLDYQVDGIVTASVSMSNTLTKQCEAAGIPVLMFNRTQDDERLSAVTSDNISGGRKAAEHLIKAGHQRLGYIAGWEGASTQRDREMGFQLGLAQAGIQLFNRQVGQFTYEASQEAARQMFTQSTIPDAVFVANDHMAFAVMDTLRFELGLRIPDDVSVIGFDDVKAASWPSYNLTTVRQPANRMAAQAVTLMTDLITSSDRSPHRISIDGPLVVRGSTRPLKGETI